jgi:hypothetical protein
MDEAMNKLRSKGKTIISLHLRRGDYANFSKDPFFIAPNKWYVKWLNEIWDSLEDPVLYIASDEPHKVISHFQAYQPVTSKELGVSLPKASFYTDFYILTQCDMVAISNSTFSFAASMLNEHASIFMRPHPPQKALITFDPWNSEVLYRTDFDTKKYHFKGYRSRSY